MYRKSLSVARKKTRKEEERGSAGLLLGVATKYLLT